MLTEIALKEMFDELDLDKDGSVTENELVKSFEGMDEFVNGEMIREIFKSTDTKVLICVIHFLNHYLSNCELNILSLN